MEYLCYSRQINTLSPLPAKLSADHTFTVASHVRRPIFRTKFIQLKYKKMQFEKIPFIPGLKEITPFWLKNFHNILRWDSSLKKLGLWINDNTITASSRLIFNIKTAKNFPSVYRFFTDSCKLFCRILCHLATVLILTTKTTFKDVFPITN